MHETNLQANEANAAEHNKISPSPLKQDREPVHESAETPGSFMDLGEGL